MGYGRRVEFETLKGKTIFSIEGVEENSDFVKFVTDDGTFTMQHYQDCCEDVRLLEVVGDPLDLLGLVLDAYEESNSSDPVPEGIWHESYRWTFYRVQTEWGSVTLRWLGTSNGYYGESVDFEKEVTD